MKLRPFELALIFGFGLLGLFAIALLSMYSGGGDPEVAAFGGSVEVWGVADAGAFGRTLQPYRDSNEAFNAIRYRQLDVTTFESELVNALAEGRGPDLVLIPHELLVPLRTKLQPISYESFPVRDFRDRYIDGANIYMLVDGVYAYPIAIDPLVMFYNRDTLTNKNVLTPPRTWEEVVNSTVPTFVVRDAGRTITQSPLAMGEYRNVTYAFEIMSMLLLQGGSILVTEESAGQYEINLNQGPVGARSPLDAALSFYTTFALPSSPLYSWNRSLPRDEDEFVASDLVLYFAPGSKARSLAARNPNLTIDVAEVPQGGGATVRRTYGTVYGYALLRTADNKQGAYAALATLGGLEFTTALANEMGMAPVYRQSLAAGSDDIYGRIVYSAAVSARGWLNPALPATNRIFTEMVEDVLANRSESDGAAKDAIDQLELEY